tara:strand:- start:137 stop:3121 length:2985 start_codon:yes stop_codon:yes gene_type:complete
VDKTTKWFKVLMQFIARCIQQPAYASNDDDSSPMYIATSTDDDVQGVHRPKAEAFLECVLGKAGTEPVGYRFWIIGRSPDWDINLGITNLLQENAKEKEKKGKMGRPQEGKREGDDYKDCSNIHLFTSYAAQYRNKPYRGLNCTFNLMDPTDYACPTRLFSLQHAFQHADVGDDVNAVQANEHSYWNEVSNDESPMAMELVFPIPHLVYSFYQGAFTPVSVGRLELPRTHGTLHVPGIRAQLTDAEKATNEANGVIAAHGETVESEIVKNESELKSSADVNEPKYKDLLDVSKHPEYENDAGFVKAMHEFRQGVMDEFTATWYTATKTSDVLKCMVAYERQRTLETGTNKKGTLSRPIEDCRAIDRSLSPFGNMLVRRMNWIQEPYGASTSHSIILFLSLARHDAYRRGLNMHQHFILTGSGNTGKSFCLRTMGEKMSIPGTVEWVTDETKKANHIDDNQNDKIVLHHEMPDRIMGIEENQGAETGDYAIKDCLDSGEIRTKVYHLDETTGKRMNRHLKSEFIHVRGGATNETPKKIPDALLQRFSLWMVPEKEIKNRRKIDLFLDSKVGGDSGIERRVNGYFRDEQFLVCVVEKMIWVNVLPDVNMDVGRSVWRDLEAWLAPKGIDLTLTRNMARVEYLARTMTILNALELTFHNPSSDVYNQPFHMNQFLKLVPYLFCTEEIAVTAITLMSEQYVMKGESIILKDLAEKVCKYPPVEGYDGYDLDADDDDHPHWRKVRESGQYSQVTADYNFLELNGTKWDVAHVAHRFAGRTKYSVANINMMLWKLEQRKIRVKKMTSVWGVYEEEYSDLPILERSKQPNDKRLFLNVHYVKEILNKGLADAFENAVRGITTKNTRPRKIVTGDTFMDYRHTDGQMYTVPDVIRTVDLKESSRAKIVNYHSDPMAPNVEVTTDFEAFVLCDFLQDIGYMSFADITDDCPFIPANYEAEYTKANSDRPDQYPQCHLAKIFHKKQLVQCGKRRKERVYGANKK